MYFGRAVKKYLVPAFHPVRAVPLEVIPVCQTMVKRVQLVWVQAVPYEVLPEC